MTFVDVFAWIVPLVVVATFVATFVALGVQAKATRFRPLANEAQFRVAKELLADTSTSLIAGLPIGLTLGCVDGLVTTGFPSRRIDDS